MYWRFASQQFCIFDELQMRSSYKNRPIKSIFVLQFSNFQKDNKEFPQQKPFEIQLIYLSLEPT